MDVKRTMKPDDESARRAMSRKRKRDMVQKFIDKVIEEHRHFGTPGTQQVKLIFGAGGGLVEIERTVTHTNILTKMVAEEHNEQD